MSENEKPQFVKAKNAAAILEVAQQTLANWRSLGTGPAYVKFGRSVRYSLAELLDYAAAHRIQTN